MTIALQKQPAMLTPQVVVVFGCEARGAFGATKLDSQECPFPPAHKSDIKETFFTNGMRNDR